MNEANPYQPPEPTPEPPGPQEPERAIDAAFSPNPEKALAELGCVVFVVGVVLVLLIAAIDWVVSRF